MRALILTSLIAASSLASPALAVDRSIYVGINGGILHVENTEYDYQGGIVDVDDAYRVERGRGFDVDAVAGYDFGMFRVEGELAYKRASVKQVEVANDITLDGFATNFDASGSTSVISGMVNGMLDFTEGSWSGFAGAGVGYARVRERFAIDEINRFLRGRDSGLAWQGIAGFRASVTPAVELGVKYRYFNVPKVRFNGDGPPIPFTVDGKFRSHSLLASLVYNLIPPPVIVPAVVEVAAPPVSAPATQTCPDGSVILATDVCPVPPPPPPGERG